MKSRFRTRTPARVFLVMTVGLLAVSLGAGTASAAQQVEGFSVTTSTTQAGGHPNITTEFTLVNPGQAEAAKNVVVNLPEGVFGNPHAIPACEMADFALSECPSVSQVGLVTVRGSFSGDPNFLLGTAPIYDLNVQVEGDTARLAFVVPALNLPIAVPIAVRTSRDYGLRLTVSGITQALALAGAKVTVWGFPASDEHEFVRFPKGSPGDPPGCVGESGAFCASSFKQAPIRTGLVPAPFIDNPSVCTGQPQVVSMRVQTYQDPEDLSEASDQYPASTGCEQQTFKPSLAIRLTTEEADSPSGMDLTLKAPLFLGEATTPSNIRSATLTLPPGITINPDAADGQSACTGAQANFESEDPHNCPDSSKIGNFDIRTPALIGPLNGSLYFGEPVPGNQYRVFMMASGFGINAKLVASVNPDPETGQLTMSVIDLPQVPFDEFNLHLFASDRGLVATPTHCRIYSADSLFVPWNSKLAPQRPTPNVSVTSGPGGRPCPGITRPFTPRLVAGTSNPVAGEFSSFFLKLDRDDGDQFLRDLAFRMPPGFTGNLSNISYCSEGAIRQAADQLGRIEQEQPSCRARSQVGTTNVAAGPGGHPFHAVGKMYLAGPFQGAPLSLVAITPAVAGPYDYGNQVVRVALSVDPLTAQVSAVSDRMPQIIGGVPIRMRSIRVNIDKPEFTINPTNCSNFTVDSKGIGDQDTATDFSSPFHAVNCARLGFVPKMTVKQLGKRKDTKRSRNPRMRFELRTRSGDANLKSLTVTLPKAFAIDQRHLGNICSKAQLERESCAGRQPIGNVETRTPLLDAPLRGPAYAVSGFGKLPRLAFILDGQVRIVPQAESSSRKGRLTTVVPVIPDAPVGYFKLDLLGGKQGYLVNTRNLCAGPSNIGVSYVAQNGKTHSQRVRAKTACGKARASSSKHRR